MVILREEIIELYSGQKHQVNSPFLSFVIDCIWLLAGLKRSGDSIHFVPREFRRCNECVRSLSF